MGILISATATDTGFCRLVGAVFHFGFGFELFGRYINLGMGALSSLVQFTVGSRDGSSFVVHSNIAADTAEKRRSLAPDRELSRSKRSLTWSTHRDRRSGPLFGNN